MFPFVESDGVGANLIRGNFQLYEVLPIGQCVESGNKLGADPLVAEIWLDVQFLNLADFAGMVQQVLNMAAHKPNNRLVPFGNEVMNHWIR